MRHGILIILLFTSAQVFGQQRLAHVKNSAEILNEKYCTAIFSSADGQYFDLLDDQVNASANSFFNILDWLRGRVAGLQVYTTKDRLLVPFIRNQRAAIYVDEMWVSFDYLNMLPVADIAMIKVIKGPFIGNRGSGGTIAIYTIRGDEDEPESAQ